MARRCLVMTNDSDIERIWEIVENTGICMMTTRFAEGLRARPLEARPDKDHDALWFLTDVRGLKDDEVKTNPEVCLTFVCSKQKAYLSLTGKAFVSRDPEQAKALWNQEQQAWWPGGPDDPNVRVMRVDLARAEMWDGPASSVVAAFEFASARLTGTKPKLGENRKVTVEMGKARQSSLP